MRRSVGKVYIKKERKWNVICTLAVVCIMAIVIAILELLPGNSHELGYSDMNGIGRSFMYPFVFTDERNDLYVMKDDMSVSAIDDAVSFPRHDPLNDNVYYVKNNALYEYSVKSNSRILLTENAAEYSLLGNRRAIVCKDRTGGLVLYMFKGNQSMLLTKNSSANDSQKPVYAVSDEGVLYSDGNRLMYTDYIGSTTTITENLNVSRKFYISEDGELVCYYENDIMYISEIDGSARQSAADIQPILFQQPPAFAYPSTIERSSSDGIPFKYFIRDINNASKSPQNSDEDIAEAAESDDAAEASGCTVGTLQYFTGSTLKTISENVYRIIYYSKADDFILYSVPDGDGMYIYMSTDGKNPVRQIRCGLTDNFIFDDRTNYLYYQNAEGSLYRYDIYDVDFKTVKVADNTGNIFDYLNRPFVAYEDAATDEIYLVLSDKIERLASNMETRLYGRSNDAYLLCRQNADGYMTIDYVKENKITRIAGNADADIFFDRDIETVIYDENDRLYVYSGGKTSEIGEYRGIKAVDIVK